MISIIVAIAGNNAIGRNNDLLWHIPEDLKRFKRITSGHQVLMGKRTYESLPFRPLPKRENIVLTDIEGEIIEGCTMAYSIEEAVSKISGECFVMGGGMVYKQFIPLADKLYLTKVNKDFEADTFFPEINYDEWELIEEEKKPVDPALGFSYSYQTYKRRQA